jgi:dTDP-4-amino-4,6-dideoxygalactose transaminase
MKPIDPLLVSKGLSARELMARMDVGAQGILLLVDDTGRLQRTITDGDLRRVLLAGAPLDAPVPWPDQAPVTAPAGATDEQLLAAMLKAEVNHIPVVDGGGVPVALVHLRDLDKPILLSTPHMGEQELDFVNQAFDTNWIAPLGPNVDAFEKELADHVGAGHAAAVGSGTAAIHLALVLLDVKPGDIVFCSSLTFVASANPILYQGATPVFIDSEPGTWNMSPAALGQALEDHAKRGRLPKAVVVVNLYGQSADMDPLRALCDAHGVPVVEDAAESLGATYKGRSSGTLGRIGIYSFNGNKIITTSGGGMLVSQDESLVRRARFLATQARDNAPWYEHTTVGFNYRMSNVLAGIGRGQLRVLADRVRARRAIFDRYHSALGGCPGVGWMPEAAFGVGTRWLSVMTLDPGAAGRTPAELIAALAQRKIEARRVWKPMHRQPLFKACAYYPHSESESFSDRAFDQGVCLPSGSNTTAEQIDRICSVIARAL